MIIVIKIAPSSIIYLYITYRYYEIRSVFHYELIKTYVLRNKYHIISREQLSSTIVFKVI